MLGREHQQTEARRDGATLQPDGAVARWAGMLQGQAAGGSGWQQIADPAKLRRVWKGQTNPQGESERTERAGHGRILRVWVENVGAHRGAKPSAVSHEGGQDPGL